MPTRLYFPSTGSASNPPATTGWTSTAGASAALAMVRTKIGSSMTTITSNGSGAVGDLCLLRQYVSEQLPYSMTISGKVMGVIRCIESSASGNNTLAMGITVWDNAGTPVIRGTLLTIVASDSTADPYEMGRTTATASAFYDVNENCYHTLSAVNAVAGDRVVVEIGFREGSTTTTRTGGVVCGDNSATDLPFMSINTNTDNPWIEFTADLFCRPGEGYFS